jgi:hypothetical protein
MPNRARADITEQFFTAGELMERAVETDHFLDLEQQPGARGLRAWLALAAASALGLLVLVALTI